MEKATWFSTWFDSPYYHQLYASRDDQEAKHFIETLQAYLKIPAGALVLSGQFESPNSFLYCSI